ncbi:MAG: DUF2087 domain-containing protein [Desulfovibrio sp.]|nr:MAG: DUF2087 domain-containing protein [Desulfovibrio sp.]
MSKTPLPFVVGDISSFTRSLRQQLQNRDSVPSHVELLNLLAKSGGFRNFQHFRAQHQARENINTPRPQPIEIDYKLVKRLARFFDSQGRLMRWPKKFTQRMLCLWVMWSRLPAKVSLNEQEISDFLEDQHLFGDHALLRRELVDRKLVTRTPDGREYRRIEQQPPGEAMALIEHLKQ